MKAVETPEFQSFVQRLSTEYKQGWTALWNAARERSAPKSSDPLWKALFFARNHVAFHYAEKMLREAYTGHFRIASDKPAVSLGESMEQTRFYYADAAAAGYLHEVQGLTSEQWVGVAKQLNKVLYALLHQFVDARARKHEPYTPSSKMLKPQP